jgi:transcriptional regulator with AAA-type ATPase domain
LYDPSDFNRILRVAAADTETLSSKVPRRGGRPPEWTLAVALDCERLSAPPLRLALAPVSEVEIGRGPQRAVRVANGRLRLDLPDRWTSRLHMRFVRAGEGWVVEDAGSKNGTLVNGREVDRAALVDGDFVECGGTFLVLRRAEGPIADLEIPSDRPEALRTLSPALEREFDILAKMAGSDVPVIVRGESGTGKEVMASAIHTLSGRDGPLVAVNCGAIPATLIESELFGSRRGAFSGAEDRPGLVRSAEDGTLFLDEIAELPAASQAALLRLLQEREVQPLGAGKPVVVDVRVVAATHQPLEQLVDAGRFRRDLYARLRGYELHLPPLRARMEDLGLLIANLVKRLDPEEAPRHLSRAAARALFRHLWPFHVRELEQVLRTALTLTTRPEIDVDDLRLVAHERKAGAEAAVAGSREQLVALLDKHGGNLSAVARELATSRSQVQRLLARHSLTRREGRWR